MRVNKDEFVDSLDSDAFVLTNLPAGVTKGVVNRISDTEATIALVGNRTVDYDVDITNLNVRVAASQFENSDSDLIAKSGVTFTAIVDVATLTLSNDGSINEGAENGEVITVMLSGGTLADTLQSGNWLVENLPTGVTANGPTKTSPTTLEFTLSGNATVDYDSDIQLRVRCAPNQYAGGTAELTSNLGATLTANNDAESISISNVATINEGSENGGKIRVALTGGTFVDPISDAAWTVTGLPAGVTKGSVSRISATEVQITLSGNSSSDFDSDITGISVSCQSSQVSAGDGTLTDNSGVIITAGADAESISASWASAPGTNGAEATLDSDKIRLTLTGGQFVSGSVGNITISAGSGITKESVSYVDATHVDVNLAWDGTDFDSNEVITVNVPVSAYVDSTGALADLTDTVSAVAVDETFTMNTGTAGQVSIAPSGYTPSYNAGSVDLLNGTDGTAVAAVANGDFTYVLTSFSGTHAGADQIAVAENGSGVITLTVTDASSDASTDGSYVITVAGKAGTKAAGKTATIEFSLAGGSVDLSGTTFTSN